jgi:hypothetical protein
MQNQATATAAPVTLLAGQVAVYERRYAHAVQILTDYLEREPGNAIARAELGEALMRCGNQCVTDGRYAEAEELFEKAASYGSVGAVFSRSHCKLMRGDVDGYLADFERRWEVPTYRQQYYEAAVWEAAPRWDGKGVGTLLIHGEQGIGDIIDAARYMAAAIMFSDHAVVRVRPELVTLMRHVFAALKPTVISLTDPLPPVDAHIPTGSLAHWCRTTFPNATGARHRFGITPKPEAGVIGLRWAGSPKHPRDAERSIPEELFTPLKRGTWVNLQNEVGDILDHAPMIASCSLVISVDTATAHLAGALGVPTWLLVSKYPDPRWGMVSDTTPLYPTVRLFRQSTRGDWASVISRVQQSLTETQHGR